MVYLITFDYLYLIIYDLVSQYSILRSRFYSFLVLLITCVYIYLITYDLHWTKFVFTFSI